MKTVIDLPQHKQSGAASADGKTQPYPEQTSADRVLFVA